MRLFSCGECGSAVESLETPGRTREYARGYHIPIPEDFPIPTCVKCGETYFTPDVTEKLDPILRKAFLREQAKHYRDLVEILMRRHNTTQKAIVRVCGITPSYLSHVMAGKRQVSLTLTRLLEAFVADRSEFERHLSGRPWTHPGFLRSAPGRSTGYAMAAKWIGPAKSNGPTDTDGLGEAA